MDLRPALEIILMFLIFYGLFRFMQGTRGEGIVRGYAVLFLAFFLFMFMITQLLELRRFSYLLSNLFLWAFAAMVVIFQPEMRRGLIRLGQNPFMTALFRTRRGTVQELLKAIERLSRKKVGALIALERQIGLRGFIERGIPIDAEVTHEIIETIFSKTTPLHDGGIIISQGRLAAAACIFPLTETSDIDSTFGTRHRAALGLTDETDAVTIVVSEETGAVSYCERSKLDTNLDIKDLEARLLRASVEGAI